MANDKTGVDKYIPHRLARTKNSVPWMNTKTKKLIRKSYKISKKSKKYVTITNHNCTAFKCLKAEIDDPAGPTYKEW